MFMTAFETPEPVSVALDLVVADVRITASDRTDSVVEVRPSHRSHEADIRAAEQTQVDFTAGRLLIKAPKQKRLGLFGRIGSIDVTIDVPTGSRVDGDAASSTFRSTGRLGELRFKTGIGDIQLDQTGPLDLSTGTGLVIVERAAGNAAVSTGSGRIRLREIDGSAVIKNSNGDTWIGQVAGDLRVSAANGSISVDQANADVTASSANGDVRVRDIARGSASLKTAMGEIDIGIRAGTAARLDLHTRFGRVHNHMDAMDAPAESEKTVAVRALTSYGDIIVRRA
jgi:DUF4097 and DUF4098 domain-containing protein YvlB